MIFNVISKNSTVVTVIAMQTLAQENEMPREAVCELLQQKDAVVLVGINNSAPSPSGCAEGMLT